MDLHPKALKKAADQWPPLVFGEGLALLLLGPMRQNYAGPMKNAFSLLPSRSRK